MSAHETQPAFREPRLSSAGQISVFSCQDDVVFKSLSLSMCLFLLQPISTDASDGKSFADLQPGLRVELRRDGVIADRGTLELTVTSRIGDSFQGLIQERPAEFNTGVRALSQKVSGKLVAGQIDLVVEKFNLSADRWDAILEASGTWDVVADIRWKRQPFIIGTGLTDIASRILTERELEDFVQRFNQALSKGRRKYKESADLISRLRKQGHQLSVSGILEDGELDLWWRDYNFREDRRWVSDYAIVKQLAPLGYIHRLSLSEMPNEKDLTHVASIKTVGSLGFPVTFLGSHLTSLESLKLIRSIRLNAVTPKTFKDVSDLKELEGLDVFLNDQSISADYSDADLMHLNGMPSLARVILTIQGRPSQDAIWYLRGCQELRFLSLTVDQHSKRSMRAIAEMSNLREIELNSITSEQLLQIQSNSLERISIRHISGISDSILRKWTAPKRLISLEMPYWAPEPLADYVKSLPNLPRDEYDLYQLVRLIKDSWNEFRRHDYEGLRSSLIVWGGLLAADIAVGERSEVLGSTSRAIMTLKDSRDDHMAFIVNVAHTAHAVLGRLVAEKRIAKRKALFTQIALYRFTGRIREEIEPLITPSIRSDLEIQRRSFLEDRGR